MSGIEVPDDGQWLNTSLFSNSRPNCYLDREEVNAVGMGVIAPSSKIWENVSIQSIGIVVVVGREVTRTSRSGSVKANHL